MTPERGMTPSEPQKSIEELAAEQGVGPIQSADDLRIHGLTDEESDAFTAAMGEAQAIPPSEALRAALADVLRRWDEWYLNGSLHDTVPEFYRLKDAVIIASEALAATPSGGIPLITQDELDSALEEAAYGEDL